jgi:hypothetical protein
MAITRVVSLAEAEIGAPPFCLEHAENMRVAESRSNSPEKEEALFDLIVMIKWI